MPMLLNKSMPMLLNKSMPMLLYVSYRFSRIGILLYIRPLAHLWHIPVISVREPV